MGNNCYKAFDKPERPTEKSANLASDQIPGENSAESMIVIIPQLCQKQSKGPSAVPSTVSDNSQFSWTRMLSLYVEHSFLNDSDEITPAIMQNIFDIFEIIKQKIETIYFDLQEHPDVMHDSIVCKFEQCAKEREDEAKSATNLALTHYIMMYEINNIILESFKYGNDDLVIDIVNQITLSHALIGVTPADFRQMHMHIMLYLLRLKYIDDDQINDLVIYFNNLMKYATHFLLYQQETYGMPPSTPRDSKARQNFRLMRKWNKTVDKLKIKVKHFEDGAATKCILHPGISKMSGKAAVKVAEHKQHK